MSAARSTPAGAAHKWEFKPRFRRQAFGWRSQPAITRIKQAVAEIRKVAKKEPALAAEGAVVFLERVSPALEQVDSSSGAIGTAVNHAIAELVPVIANASVDAQTRAAWLERLFAAHQADQIPYIENLTDHWGELCTLKEVASAWADRLVGITRLALSPDKKVRSHFHGTSACLSALHRAERFDELIDLLRSELQPAALVERSDMAVRTLEGVPMRAGYVHGSGDGAVTCRVNGATFAFNLLDPHKTGFYLDQQANYGLCARHVRAGARVLDAFCHLGGFAIHAALAGAGEVIAVDQAAESIAGARAAAALSGCPTIDFRCGNAFDVLKSAERSGERFDLIVLDPPTFTRTRAAVPGALRGYKEIHLRALRMLPPGGRLATFSCSHHVDAALFLETIVDAAADAGVLIRLEERLGASADHPVLPAVPETEYLKGFVFSVVERAGSAARV